MDSNRLSTSGANGLQRLLVLFESEAACEKRLAEQGLRGEPAREVAYYLAQATDLVTYYPVIKAVFRPLGITVDFFEVGQVEKYLPLMWQSPESCILWNLTDGFRYYRTSFVTSTAALLGVKTFGSRPQAQHLCQDKYKCLMLAHSLGVRIPATTLCRQDRLLSPRFELEPGYSLFVKPNTLGAKIGILADSRCESWEQALERSNRIWNRYGDEVVVQAFIPGFDVRVSYMAVGEPGLGPQLGIYRLGNTERGETGGSFMTMRDSTHLTTVRTPQGVAGPATTGQSLAPTLINLRTEPSLAGYVAEIETMIEKIVPVLGLRDYFSFDIRISDSGQLYFLELEVCPAVTIYDFLTYLDEMYGLDLSGALSRAIPESFRRSQPGVV